MKKPALLNISIFKYLFLMFSVFLSCIACNQKTETTASNETIELNDPMEGVWQQIHHYYVANGDTVSSSNAEGEHKIYYDGYVMFTTDPEKDPDSIEIHGFGTYRYENDTVIEKIMTMSRWMKDLPGSEEFSHFPLIIYFDGNTFSQVAQGEFNDTIYQSIEVYKKLN